MYVQIPWTCTNSTSMKKKKKVEIYLKVIVLLFKKRNLQSDTVLLCSQKHCSLKNDKNLAYYYHYYYYFVIILIILIFCSSLKMYCFPSPPLPPFFSVVLDIYIKKGFPTTKGFQLYLIIIIMIINHTHFCV